jgi:hypothetical protein
LVYVKCRSADSDSSFLMVPSADTDADSPAPIEWGLEGEACGPQPRFCCYVFIRPFFYTSAGDVRSLSRFLSFTSPLEVECSYSAELKLKSRW